MSKPKKPHTHGCLLGGVALAIIYWLSETILHSKILHEGDFSAELLPLGDVNEIWIRMLIVTLFISFGIAIDIALARLSRAHRESARLVDKLEKTLAEVKTLSGLLPICAVCKKVRDNGGYWHQVEKYVRDHSDAEFSHGYCPGCAEKALRNIEEQGDTDEKDIQQTDSGDKQ